jgi:hypothetical protein
VSGRISGDVVSVSALGQALVDEPSTSVAASTPAPLSATDVQDLNLLTVQETATLLRQSKRSIRRKVAAGDLPAIRHVRPSWRQSRPRNRCVRELGSAPRSAPTTALARSRVESFPDFALLALADRARKALVRGAVRRVSAATEPVRS